MPLLAGWVVSEVLDMLMGFYLPPVINTIVLSVGMVAVFWGDLLWMVVSCYSLDG